MAQLLEQLVCSASQLQLGPALMAGNGRHDLNLQTGFSKLQLGPALMAGNGHPLGHATQEVKAASIGPGADGREWLYPLGTHGKNLELQLGPALMAGNGRRL